MAGIPPDGPGDEFSVIERIASSVRASAGPGERFSGDDCAVVLPGAGPLLFAIDAVVEGVHFDLAHSSLADAGWKAVAVNLSDVAAMGGRPLYVVASVSGPAGTDLVALAGGMVEACEAFGVALVGGDLSGGGERLVVSVAIVGTCDGRPAVLRSGASPGDEIWVTGPLGGSAAGLLALQGAGGGGGGDASLADGHVLAHLRPSPRVSEGLAAASLGATAMIDVSDGLAQDLDHIARQSGVGLRLDDIPVAAGATPEQAMGGGEDYELVFTVRAGTGVAAGFGAAGLRAPIRVGTCNGNPSERLLGGETFAITGWRHRFGRAVGGG